MKKASKIIVTVVIAVLAGMTAALMYALLKRDATPSTAIEDTLTETSEVSEVEELEQEDEKEFKTDLDSMSERLNPEDLHEDPEFIERHEELVEVSDYSWEPPTDWELPNDIYDALDDSIIAVLGGTNYVENVKWQYALYSYFGEDLKYVTVLEDSDIPGPDDVVYYWVVRDKDDNLYVTWIDAHYGFIKKV